LKVSPANSPVTYGKCVANQTDNLKKTKLVCIPENTSLIVREECRKGPVATAQLLSLYESNGKPKSQIETALNDRKSSVSTLDRVKALKCLV
jgi:hypothetical protein